MSHSTAQSEMSVSSTNLSRLDDQCPPAASEVARQEALKKTPKAEACDPVTVTNALEGPSLDPRTSEPAPSHGAGQSKGIELTRSAADLDSPFASVSESNADVSNRHVNSSIHHASGHLAGLDKQRAVVASNPGLHREYELPTKDEQVLEQGNHSAGWPAVQDPGRDLKP